MINVRMQHKEVKTLSPKITVLGVGGAGGNAVNNMISSGLQGCEFVVCNTDAQALDGSLSENKVQLGVTVTGGLGAGAKPEIGRDAAEESLDDVLQYLEGSNMAFITAGMGGGTGTGAAPVIARACREHGVLTVGVVTKPFHFEGSHRMQQAEAGIEEMQQYVDTLIVIPNQNLFRVANEKTTFAEAFKMADSVLQSGVRGVTDLMVMPGLINLDFADVRSAMIEMGKAMMGTGEADGERRAIESAEAAINNPLLDDVSMKGARGVIINVTGGLDMTLFEVDEACNRIRDEVDPNANIIFGSTFDEKLEGVMRVSVVATGIDAEQARMGCPSSSGFRPAGTNGQQERRLERAQPKTDAAASVAQQATEASTPAAPVAEAPKADKPLTAAQANIPAQGPVKAPAMSYAAAIAAARKAEEPESEMFEQQTIEVASVQVEEVVQPAAPQAQVQQEPVQQVATSGQLRGTVYNESFIPPKPAEPEQMAMPVSNPAASAPVEAPASAGPDLGALSASKPVATPPPAQTTTAPGLNLKPPVPGGNRVQKKKSPSLFERFTSPLRSHLDDSEDEQGSQGTGSSGGFAPAAPQAPQSEMQQGSLNIDAPKTDGAEDELDIPAFLRRQAN